MASTDDLAGVVEAVCRPVLANTYRFGCSTISFLSLTGRSQVRLPMDGIRKADDLWSPFRAGHNSIDADPDGLSPSRHGWIVTLIRYEGCHASMRENSTLQSEKPSLPRDVVRNNVCRRWTRLNRHQGWRASGLSDQHRRSLAHRWLSASPLNIVILTAKRPIRSARCLSRDTAVNSTASRSGSLRVGLVPVRPKSPSNALSQDQQSTCNKCVQGHKLLVKLPFHRDAI